MDRKNLFPKITKDEFLESIRGGVKDAILTMTESGDGYTGMIIREPFLEAIQKGVDDAVSYPLLDLCG